ncbi:MAG: PLDc N-terminal domain-containing protein [Verrucomicrobiota bacterium]
MNPFANQLHFNVNQGGGFISALCIMALSLWLLTLISLLRRQDMKDVDKIVWTIVLCALSFLGMVLYWFIAPPKPEPPTPTEALRKAPHYPRYSRFTQPEE